MAESKPPLGVMPRWRWIELRIEELEAAIGRYDDAHKIVPTEWLEELQEHLFNRMKGGL